METNENKREPKHLPWYQRQYWCGFINGAQVGWCVGLVTSFVVYIICKLALNIIMGI